jgi:DNA helicase-2/ATP-dependent DNA helicase PcrA
LSHDDLISFSKRIFDRFPVIRKRIAFKYQFVFIDEYQDAMADVLKIFYESVSASSSKLYLFGDRMQQIYKNYDGSFEAQFEAFDTTKALTTNYRSVDDIVKLLNRVYNDSSFVQDNSHEMKLTRADHRPRIVLSDNIASSLEEFKQSNPNALVLYLLNKQRFSDIGALNLYQVYDEMEKYSFGKTYSAVDVLTTAFIDNPDPLMKLLFCIANMAIPYRALQYGVVVQTLKAYKSMFCRESWNIRAHGDKQRFLDNLKGVFDVFHDESKTISDLLDKLVKASVVEMAYIEGIQSDDENQDALGVQLVELTRIAEYLRNPKVSTQHGVKGESHDSVVFVADDSFSNPIVHMYRFFEMWGQFPISLNAFNQFYYAYVSELSDLQSSLDMKVSDLNKNSYTQHDELICKKASAIMDKFRSDPYFNFLCREKYEQYLQKPGVTKAKDCLKESTVYGVLSAYKLFYVGCSRARRNLTVLLDVSKIKGDVEGQKEKFIEIGFDMQ